MTVRAYLNLVVALSCLACGQLGSSSSPSPTKTGVFADIGKLTELTAYAEVVGMGVAASTNQQRNYMDLDLSPPLKAKDIPVAARVRCFYVNMPNTDIATSEVLLLQEPEQGQHYRHYEDTTALKAKIEKVGEGYRLTVPELSGKKGIVALRIDIPGQTGFFENTGRFYLLRLRASEAA